MSHPGSRTVLKDARAGLFWNDDTKAHRNTSRLAILRQGRFRLSRSRTGSAFSQKLQASARAASPRTQSSQDVAFDFDTPGSTCQLCGFLAVQSRAGYVTCLSLSSSAWIWSPAGGGHAVTCAQGALRPVRDARNWTI